MKTQMFVVVAFALAACELEEDATARQRRWEELALKAPPAKE